MRKLIEKTLQNLSVQESLEYYIKINHVLALLENRFGSVESAKDWMQTPNHQFENQMPSSLFVSVEGIDKVISTLKPN